MDINFIDKNHLTYQLTTAKSAVKCDNCSSWYENDLRLQDAKVEKLGSTGLDTEALIWDALAFIYGVSWTSIQNYNSKKGSDLLKTPDDLRFCCKCAGLLNDNYNSHLKLEQSSDSSSILQLLKEFRDYQTNLSEKRIDIQVLSNDLVDTVDSDIKVDLNEDFVVEDTEEDPFESEDQVEIKCESPSTFTEYFSIENTSDLSRSRALTRLQSKQLVIKTEKLSPEEMLQFPNKINDKKKRSRPKKRKGATTVKNLGGGTINSLPRGVRLRFKKPGIYILKSRGNGPNVTKRAESEEECPLEKKILKTVKNLKARKRKAVAKKKKEINSSLLSLPFEEKVKLVMEKYKDQTQCCKISLKGQFICTKCGKGFKDYAVLKFSHWPTHQEPAILVCDICGKSMNRRYLKFHKIRAHAPEKEQNKYKTKCNLCDEMIFYFTMSNHLNLQHSKLPEEKFKCNQCGKLFASNTRLKSHLIEVHNNASGICDLLDKVSTLPAYKKNQKRNANGEKERKYCCEICPHKVFTKSELKNHKLSHSDVRQYICDECGKTFKYISHFREHMKCHKEIAEKGEGSITCDLCEGKTFKHSLSLRKHIENTHGKGKLRKRKYECSVCSKQLSSATVLRDHENLHKENPGFKPPPARNKLSGKIIKGPNPNDKLTDSSQIPPVSATEATDISQ